MASELAKLMELHTTKQRKLTFGEFSGWFTEAAKAFFLHNHERRRLQRDAEKQQTCFGMTLFRTDHFKWPF